MKYYIFQFFVIISLSDLLTGCGESPENPIRRTDNKNCVEVQESPIYSHSLISNASHNSLIKRWGKWEFYQTELQNIIEKFNESLTDYPTPCSFLPYIKKYETMKNGPIRSDIRFKFEDLIKLNKDQFQWTITIKNLKEKKVGQCRKDRIIVIDYTQWEISNSSEKQVLLFHELGHCDLDKEHDDSQLSIMNSNITDAIRYIRFLDFVNNEEASSCKLKLYRELFNELEPKQESSGICSNFFRLFFFN